MDWTVNHIAKPKLRSPVLIEGLPGIGNVGKIVADFLVERLDAKPCMRFSSHYLPHSVFVNEKNLVELPEISLYWKSTKKQDFLFLVGDAQPIDEPSSYALSELVLEEAAKLHCKHVIALGGIGLAAAPKEPKVFITGNDARLVKDFLLDKELNGKIYGVVGPIIGITGLLVGLAKRKKLPAVAMLSETMGHPMYLGLRGAKAILRSLDKRYHFKLDLTGFDKDIEELETEDIDDQPLPKSLKKFVRKETSYIG
ncbi:MAG: PAC2 family protein [Nanoarchaeota archaeon]